MPDVPTDEELTPLDSALKPVKSAVGYSSADRPIGPTPATGEMRAAPGPLVRGAEEVGRTGAFAAGEMAGSAVGGPAGAAVGAGATGTAADAVIAYINHKKYGTPIDITKKTLAEDFLLNAGTSAVLGGVGKIAQGGIPAEAEAIKSAATKAQGAASGFRESVTEQGQAALEKLTKEQETQLGKVSPQAQMEAIQQTTGRQEGRAAVAVLPKLDPVTGDVMGPSPATLAKQGGLRGAYFSVRNRLSEAYGSQYEKLLGPYNSNRITDLSPINDTLDRWEAQFTEENRPAPPPARILLNDARDLSPKSFLDTATAKVAGPLSGPAKAALKVADKRLTPLRGEAGDIPMASSTVARILALKRAAQQTMVKTTDARSRQIAEEIADAANQTLGNTGGLPPDVKSRLGALNSQYADYKRMFPHADVKTMATAQTPIEQADHIFNNATLADRVISNAKPEEKKILQDSFGDWAQLHSGDVLAKGATRQDMRADALIKSRVYGKLFPGSPLADPNSIIYVGATAQNIEQAPQMKALFDRAMQQAQQQAVADGAKAVRDAGVKAAKDLGGPAGDRLLKSIETANLKSPEEAAQVATQFFTGFSPQQFVQELAKDQPRFGASLAQKTSGGFWLKRMATDPSVWPYIAGMGGVQALMFGRPSWYLEMSAMGAPMIARKLITNAFTKGLKDPAAAAALLSGTKAARIGVMKPLTETVFKAASDEVGSRLAQKALGITTEPEAEEDEEAGGAEAAQ